MTEWSPGSVFERDVVVVGGCGHVGLPLAIALADRGARVGVYDLSEAAVGLVNGGELPFAEPGAAVVLKRVVAEGRLAATDVCGDGGDRGACGGGDRDAGG